MKLTNKHDQLNTSLNDFINVKDLLSNFTSQVKSDYQPLYESVINMFDQYITKHDDLLNDLWYEIQSYNDDHYTDPEMDAMCLQQEVNSWKDNFIQLKHKYEELQNLFVEIDEENQYLKENVYPKQVVELNAQIDTLKARLRETK